MPEEIGLDGELAGRICHWNARYQPIIPLGVDRRAAERIAERIRALDEEGLALAREIIAAEPGWQVRCFGEGRLRYLR